MDHPRDIAILSEFWFILLGQIRYTIEGLPTFIAEQGDIVYVPKQR